MSFDLDLRAFIEKAKGNAEQVVKKVGIDMLASVIDKSPVGNPELWKVNKDARAYNGEVMSYNANLRTRPENLTKNGRLKRGLKINDGMDYVMPDGYVGGRFRGNWQVSFGVPASGETGMVDPESGATLNVGSTVIAAYRSGIDSIWITNNVPYSVPLEYGHSSQTPLGMVRVTMADVQIFVGKAVQELDR